MNNRSNLVVLAIFTYFSATGAFAGQLLALQKIDSQYLKYTTQYQVYLPSLAPESEAGEKKLSIDKASLTQQDASLFPTLYLTDGTNFIKQMRIISKLDRLIEQGKIHPIIVVFIDHRDPNNLNINRRDKELLCNRSFIDYLTNELVPAVDNQFPTHSKRESRAIAGFSFGGLNSVCTGLVAADTFSSIGVISPVVRTSPGIYSHYKKLDKLPLKFFLSTGTINDNASKTKSFRKILKDKGYDYHFKQIKEGHNWDNFEAMIDDMLIYFFGEKRE